MSLGWSFDRWPTVGSVEVEARRGDGLCAKVTFAAWTEHLAIQAIAWGAGEVDESGLLNAILARYVAPPARITHATIARMETLAWYAKGPLADRAVVCGTVGLIGYTYDPVATLDLAQEPAELGVSVLVDDDFRPILAADADVDALRRTLLGATWLARVVALRRVARGGRLSQEDAEALHWLALTDDASAVRQFAAVQASCMFVDQPWRPTLVGVRAALADPLAALDALGPRPEKTADGRPFTRAQARHNARLAWLWIAGNLAWMTDGYHAPGMEPVRCVGEGLRADMAAEAARFDGARDRWLATLVDRELDGGALGLGVDAPMTLFDITRYAVLRALRHPAAPQDDDRRAWLVRSTEALVPPGGASEVARVLYGSAPEGAAKPSAHAATTAAEAP